MNGIGFFEESWSNEEIDVVLEEINRRVEKKEKVEVIDDLGKIREILDVGGNGGWVTFRFKNEGKVRKMRLKEYQDFVTNLNNDLMIEILDELGMYQNNIEIKELLMVERRGNVHRI